MDIYVKHMYVLCTYIQLHNCYIHVHVVDCEALLQESQGLITYAFVILLLAMISLHMLTFRLMVTMVAEFCSSFIIHCWER